MSLQETKIATESCSKLCDAREITIEGADAIQYLYVPPRAAVQRQAHKNQWEVLLRLSHKTAHVCLPGESTDIINENGAMLLLLAIRGHSELSYEDFCAFFQKFGFTVKPGPLKVEDDTISL